MSDESLRSQVDGLLELAEDQLFAELGIRARAMHADPRVAGSYSPRVVHRSAEMDALEDVREFGRRVFKRWNVQAWELVCGTDADDSKDREDFLGAIGIDRSVATAALAGLLVSHLTLAPAVAAVAAAIIMKRFARPLYDEFCSSWKGSLPAAPGGSAPAAG